jgi:hypothetical protein
MMSSRYRIFLTQILLLFTIGGGNAFASNPDSTGHSVGIGVNYWGILAHTPGLKVGLDKIYLKTSKFEIIGSASLLLNRKPDNYSSAGINFGSTLRRIGKRGFYLEHGINIGYLGNYYDYDIYKTNSDGDIVNVGRQWNSTIMIGYSIGTGYDFSKKTDTNLKLFFKPGIFYCLPNKTNFYYVNNYSIEIGLVLYPKWLNKNKYLSPTSGHSQ